MKIKASCLFLLALLATTCDSSGFDHFWLVQVWPSGYCLQANCSQTSDRFIIHGLWAVNVVDKTLPGTAGKGDPSIRPSVHTFPPCLLFACHFFLLISIMIRSHHLYLYVCVYIYRERENFSLMWVFLFFSCRHADTLLSHEI